MNHRYILGMFTTAYALSFLDRTIINVLGHSIITDLELTDWQFGLLAGPAFAFFYTFLGIPIARLSDRKSRPKIIAWSMGIWSFFTVVSGFASSFGAMAVARIGVGFGEGGCTPASHSMLADIFPAHKRASTLSIYSLGIPIGVIMGFVVGGLVADAYGWRVAFMAAGAPGLILALVTYFTIKDPRETRPSIASDLHSHAPASFKVMLKALSGKRTFWLVAFGGGIVSMVSYGHGAFGIPFVMRVHGEEITAMAAGFGLKPLGFMGIVAALTAGVITLLGTWLGGFVSDRLAARDKRAYTLVPAYSKLATLPFFWFIYQAESVASYILLGLFPFFLGAVWLGPSFATIQSVVPVRSRATAAAIFLFIVNILGIGIGPVMVGVVSNILSGPYGLGEVEGLRWAMILCSSPMLVGTFLFWLASKSIVKDIES